MELICKTPPNEEIEKTFSWEIENFLELLEDVIECKELDFVINNIEWNIVLISISKCIYFIVSNRDDNLNAEERGHLRININKIDGSSYLNISMKKYENGFLLTLSKKDLLASMKELSEVGSLHILITHNSENEQSNEIAEDIAQTIFLNTREVASQSDLLEDDETLSKDFKELLSDGRHSDVKVRVGEKEFHVHKCVLAARSPVLDSMFSQQMLENINGVVNINDCEADVFKCFLTYLYSGQLDQIPSSSVAGLYEMADKYNLQELRKKCIKRLIIELSVDTVCDVLHVAALHQEERELMERASNFFSDNTELVLASYNWNIFLKDHPAVANELFLKSYRALNLSKTTK